MQYFYLRLIFLVGISFNLYAEDNCQSSCKSKNTIVSIRDYSGFNAFNKTLTAIVKERTEGENITYPQHFCVSKFSLNEKHATMYWQEKKLLWIMTIGGEDETSWLSVRYPSSGQLLSLPKDVVEKAEDIGASSYIVTKQWAALTLYNSCVLGDVILVNK